MSKKFIVNGKNIIPDVFNDWSINIVAFKSKDKCIGNGEKKLAKELGITMAIGGQNSTIDLKHPVLGNISVKDMTNCDCLLGTEGCENMRVIFRTIINPFVCWILKYKSNCKLAERFYTSINKKYGSSRITILEGIDRYELSATNLTKLNSLLDKLKQYRTSFKYISLKSEYITDIIKNLGKNSLQELLNECVRKEATDMTLIIVDKRKGWCVVKNTNKLICPRITRGAPRIKYK